MFRKPNQKGINMNHLQKQARLNNLAKRSHLIANRIKRASFFSGPDTQKRDVTIQYTPEEIELLKKAIDPKSKGSILPPAVFGAMGGAFGGITGMAASKGNPLAGLAGLAIGGGLGALTGHGIDRLSRWENRSKLEKILSEIDKNGRRKVSVSPAEINMIRNQAVMNGAMFGGVGGAAATAMDPMSSHNDKLLQSFAKQYPDL